MSIKVHKEAWVHWQCLILSNQCDTCEAHEVYRHGFINLDGKQVPDSFSYMSFYLTWVMWGNTYLPRYPEATVADIHGQILAMMVAHW